MKREQVAVSKDGEQNMKPRSNPIKQRRDKVGRGWNPCDAGGLVGRHQECSLLLGHRYSSATRPARVFASQTSHRGQVRCSALLGLVLVLQILE